MNKTTKRHAKRLSRGDGVEETGCRQAGEGRAVQVPVQHHAVLGLQHTVRGPTANVRRRRGIDIDVSPLLDLHDGAGQFISVAASANRYIEEQAPWNLAKEGRQAELDVVLANLTRTAVRLAILAYPFIPRGAEAIWGLVCPGLRLAQTSFEEGVLGVEGRAVGKPPIHIR